MPSIAHSSNIQIKLTSLCWRNWAHPSHWNSHFPWCLTEDGITYVHICQGIVLEYISLWFIIRKYSICIGIFFSSIPESPWLEKTFKNCSLMDTSILCSRKPSWFVCFVCFSSTALPQQCKWERELPKRLLQKTLHSQPSVRLANLLIVVTLFNWYLCSRVYIVSLLFILKIAVWALQIM